MGFGIDLTYAGEQDGRGGPSYDLFKNCPVAQIRGGDKNVGVCIDEDFDCFGGTISTTTGTYIGRSGAWLSYNDSSTSFTQVADGPGGLEYNGTTSDNIEGAIQAGYGVGGMFKVGSTAIAEQWFETRVAKELVTNTQGFFLGLAAPGSPANSFMADAGADIASASAFGFFAPDADGDRIDFVFKKSGGSLVTVKQGICVPTAAGYNNLGWYFNSRTIVPYVDGVAYPEYAISNALLVGSTFPKDVAMMPIFAHKQGSNVDQYTRVSFIKAYQRTLV